MNNIKEFNKLEFDEKSKVVWLDSTFIITKIDDQIKKNLYYYNGYYIELFYNMNKMQIEKIEASDKKNVIDEYLEEIELNEIN